MPRPASLMICVFPSFEHSAGCVRKPADNFRTYVQHLPCFRIKHNRAKPMFELASALFSIADANEFRFARFYIVCEEVALAPLKSPFIVCGLSDTPVDCQSVAKTRNLMPDAARKKYSHFTLKNTSRSCTHNRFRANVYLYNCPEEIPRYGCAATSGA